METEYSKRVYQGVRVKHTVKDLLAEKRSRQNNVPRYNGGSPSPSQPAFVPMSGSHVLPGYYGVRRSFMSDAEVCHPSKQFSSEAYPSPLGGKPLSCDGPSVTGYPSLIDSYYSDSFGDYRSAPFPSAGGSLFPSSALPSILPPFSGDSSHFLLRDSWDQTGPDSVSQADGLCSEGLVPVTAPSSLANPDSGSPGPYRASSRSAASLGSQPYSLHPLEDVHYPPLYPPTSSYTCPPYMGPPSDLASKITPLSSEESEHGTVLSDAPSWSKDEGGGSWSPYEIRRAY